MSKYFGKINLFWEKSKYFEKNQFILGQIKIFWEKPLYFKKNP